MTIVPISQDNKGRFNRRVITLTGNFTGYNSAGAFEGITDTGKKVYVKHLFKNVIGVRYVTDDLKNGCTYDFSLGWKNQYEITDAELQLLIK